MDKKDGPTKPTKYQRQVLSDMGRIGSSVRSRRERLKLSQDEVASWLEMKTRRYGYFESGRARLTPTEIAAIQARLDSLEKGELYLRLRPLNLLSETDFLAIQQNLLAKWTYTDFWFFGIRHLPVLRDSSYQKVWAKNLLDGINYRLVWCLDEDITDAIIQLFQNTVSEIIAPLKAKKNKDATGKVKIYGVCIGNPQKENTDSALAKNYQRFTSLRDHLRGAHFKAFADLPDEPLVMSEPKFEQSRPVLQYGWLRSVVCYEGSQGVNSFAAVLFENVSNDPKSAGDGESGWTFLTPKPTAALLVHIRALRNL